MVQALRKISSGLTLWGIKTLFLGGGVACCNHSLPPTMTWTDKKLDSRARKCSAERSRRKLLWFDTHRLTSQEQRRAYCLLLSPNIPRIPTSRSAHYQAAGTLLQIPRAFTSHHSLSTFKSQPLPSRGIWPAKSFPGFCTSSDTCNTTLEKVRGTVSYVVA